jgi:NitT/TauT family transport system substrate-binding protein
MGVFRLGLGGLGSCSPRIAGFFADSIVATVTVAGVAAAAFISAGVFTVTGAAAQTAVETAVARAPAAETQATQTLVKFGLDHRIEGPAAPFLVGIDQGYYRGEGLDVAIDSAADSTEAITRVASGRYDMGVGDINALIKFRDQNPGTPVRAVFMVYNRPPFSIVTRRSRGVTAPKDLEGKKLGAPAADSAFAQWKIFVHANGIDESRVAIEDVGAPVREPMLAAGQLDAITGASFSSYVNLKDRGVPIDDVVVLMMADYGVELYGHAIIVNARFAAAHPDAVKGFVRAFLKALRRTAKDPAAAVESVLQRNGAARRDVELERLTMALRDNILTPQVRAGGLGGVDGARLDKTIDQIALTYAFRARPKGADIFDPSALPPAADRMAD